MCCVSVSVCEPGRGGFSQAEGLEPEPTCPGLATGLGCRVRLSPAAAGRVGASPRLCLLPASAVSGGEPWLAVSALLL